MSKQDELKKIKIELEKLKEETDKFTSWASKEREKIENQIKKVYSLKQDYLNKIIDVCLDLIKISVPVVLASWTIDIFPINKLKIPFLILAIACLVIVTFALQRKQKFIMEEIRLISKNFKVYDNEFRKRSAPIQKELNRIKSFLIKMKNGE